MMNKRSLITRSLPVVLILMSLLTGCAGLFQKPLLDQDRLTPEFLQQITQRQYDKIRSLEGYAKITIKSPQQGFSADTHILLKKPDSVYFKIEAAFGIDVGVFFADRSQYLLYTPMHNLSYSGSVDSLHNSPFIDLEISYDQLLHTITGIEALADLENQHLVSTPDEIVITGTHQGLFYRYNLDPRYGTIRETEIKDKNGTLLAKHQYKRFNKVNGVRLPFHIRIIHPERNEMFSLFYSRVRLNKSIDKDRFVIKRPSNVLHLNL